MKFITVLLAVLGVFSPVVLSQKVDPLASSSVIETAEEDVSSMVSSGLSNSDRLSYTFLFLTLLTVISKVAREEGRCSLCLFRHLT